MAKPKLGRPPFNTVGKTLAELANDFDISLEDLRECLRKKVFRPKVYGKQGVPHLFDADKVYAALPDRLKDKAQRPPATDEGTPIRLPESFQTAKARKMAADADAAEMNVARTRAQTLLFTDVTEVIDDHFAQIRTRLRAIPDKISPALVAASKSIKAVRAILADEIDSALEELSGGDKIAGEIRENISAEFADVEFEIPEFETTETDDGEPME